LKATASSSRHRTRIAASTASRKGKKQFKCDIKNGTPADLYKYWIKIKTLRVVDPWVVNY
jgi:hypothetical protein